MLAIPNALGTAGELRIAADLTARGYIVAFPVAHTSPYDLIYEKHGMFLRVQCKAAEVLDRIRISVNSCTRNKRPASREFYDVLAVFEGSTGLIHYYTIDDIEGQSQFRPRNYKEIIP